MKNNIDPKYPVHIVAGNYDQYRKYVQEKQKNVSPYQYKYVTNVDSLRGLTYIQGFFIGTYYERPDIQEINRAIHHIKQRIQQKEEAIRQREEAIQKKIVSYDQPKPIDMKQVYGGINDWMMNQLIPPKGLKDLLDNMEKEYKIMED